MFVEKNEFLKYENLSEEQKKFAYETLMLFIIDASKGGFTKSSVIAENASTITKLTNMTLDQIRSSYEIIQNDTNQLNFGVGKRDTVGFKST